MARLSSRAGHPRGLASAVEHQGPPKVNVWDDPLHPSKWKDEHFVVVSRLGWGLLFYGGDRYFIKGQNEDKQEKEGDRSR